MRPRRQTKKESRIEAMKRLTKVLRILFLNFEFPFFVWLIFQLISEDS